MARRVFTNLTLEKDLLRTRRVSRQADDNSPLINSQAGLISKNYAALTRATIAFRCNAHTCGEIVNFGNIECMVQNELGEFTFSREEMEHVDLLSRFLHRGPLAVSNVII